MKKSLKALLTINSLLLFLVLSLVATAAFFVSRDSRFQPAQGAEEEDTTPPSIMEVSVKEVTTTSTLITWKTNEDSDSLLNYGLDKGYGVLRSPGFDKKEHKIEVNNLLPETTYYFRITSSDKNGNQGISNDYVFITPKIGEEEEEEAEDTKKPGEGEEELPGSGSGEGEAGQSGSGSGEGNASQEGTGAGSGEKEEEGMGRGEGDAQNEGEGGGASKEILEQIEKITNREVLEQIQEKVEVVAAGMSNSPFIIESVPEVVEVGTDFVTIRWKTSIEANSVIALASENNYNPDAADPYAWKEGEPDVYVTDHEVTINGLQAATTYHFQAQSRSKLNLMVKSPDKTFVTKSILPEIYNINIEKLEEDAATLVWYTNVPCSSIVEYTNLENSETKSEGNPNFVTRHSIRLANLKFDTTYAAIIRVENEYGEKNNSAPLTFTTIKDEVPPVISKVSTESTIYPGADSKIQTIINWETDEPSICQFKYHQGLFSKGEESELPLEVNYANKHIQVAIEFQQATVYKFWIICKDSTGNQAKSEDFTLLTPQKEQSILDIIIANFQSTFGWMKKIGK